MNQVYSTGVVVLAGILALGGCGDKTEPKVQIVVSDAAPVAVAAAANALGQRYDATLAEGIDFKKQGYPNFLTEVSGMSGYEPWGRWTEGGPTAKFRFKQALPKKFTLDITATAFGPNVGAPVKVRAGSVEKTFVITNKAPNTYRLQFVVDGTVDSLEFTPPKPTSPSEILPNNGDGRKLGIGLIALKISD
jgi:hypothetical protein